MARHTVRLEDWQSDGLEHLSDEYDLNISELLRRSTTELLNEWDEEVPEHVRRQATHDEIVRENKPFLRGMHFRQRVHQYLLDALTNDEGHIARFAPHPDKVREVYGERIKEEARDEYPEYADEFVNHVEERLDWYEMMHPETRESGDRQFLVELARHHFMRGREDDARDAVENMISRLGLRTTDAHEILDEARNQAHDAKWKAEWDRSIRGDS